MANLSLWGGLVTCRILFARAGLCFCGFINNSGRAPGLHIYICAHAAVNKTVCERGLNKSKIVQLPFFAAVSLAARAGMPTIPAKIDVPTVPSTTADVPTVQAIKIGVHPHASSIWLLYNDGDAKLRQRLMPVRDLRRLGAAAAARALALKHAKYLSAQRVSFAQLTRLCEVLEHRQSARPTLLPVAEGAPPSPPYVLAGQPERSLTRPALQPLSRELLLECAGDLGSSPGSGFDSDSDGMSPLAGGLSAASKGASWDYGVASGSSAVRRGLEGPVGSAAATAVVQRLSPASPQVRDVLNRIIYVCV